jgi:hypothetical protein
MTSQAASDWLNQPDELDKFCPPSPSTFSFPGRQRKYSVAKIIAVDVVPDRFWPNLINAGPLKTAAMFYNLKRSRQTPPQTTSPLVLHP